MLNKLLRGGILENDPQARREWAAIQRRFEPPSGFRMRVVDVNRTSKGTKAGGLYRFGAMVVVGNGEGVLGWGQGKAAELQAAVKKAYTRACQCVRRRRVWEGLGWQARGAERISRPCHPGMQQGCLPSPKLTSDPVQPCSNLFPIPRYNGHTIPEGTEAKFGQVKMVLYPKCSGKGIVANDMIASICKLAGIHDIGVKIHGSRNRRNAGLPAGRCWREGRVGEVARVCVEGERAKSRVCVFVCVWRESGPSRVCVEGKGAQGQRMSKLPSATAERSHRPDPSLHCSQVPV